jgi:hypothetical protein
MEHIIREATETEFHPDDLRREEIMEASCSSPEGMKEGPL